LPSAVPRLGVWRAICRPPRIFLRRCSFCQTEGDSVADLLLLSWGILNFFFIALLVGARRVGARR